jgi:hypothetical protein
MDLTIQCQCPFCEQPMVRTDHILNMPRPVFECECGFEVYYPNSLEVYPSLNIKILPFEEIKK